MDSLWSVHVHPASFVGLVHMGRKAPPLPRLPTAAWKTRQVSRGGGEGRTGVSRSSLDNPMKFHRHLETSFGGYPHRPQVKQQLEIYSPDLLDLLDFDLANLMRCGISTAPTEPGRKIYHDQRATHAPSSQPLARSPRRTFTPAPTRQSSCRWIRQNNCRCTGCVEPCP